MILHIYTIVHVLISLVGIFTGLIVLVGMFAGKRLDGWTKWFLITAVATTEFSIDKSWVANEPQPSGSLPTDQGGE